MASAHRIATLTLSALLASTGVVGSSSLRSPLKLQADNMLEKTMASAAIVSKSNSTSKAGQSEPHLMGGVNAMRAEMCAHQKFGVSDEYDECLKFMVGACVPGLDMLMNGSPGEISTGKGYCTNFFLSYKAGQPGGNAAVAPVDGESLATLPDDTTEEEDFPADDDRVVAGAEGMEDVMEEVGELMRARSSSADEMKEDLAALNWYEDELQAKMDALNEDEYCRQVEKESVLVGEETSAPEMAGMLADMRCEMHRYSMPFYTRLLQKKLDEVRDEQKELVLKIEAKKQENRTEAADDVAEDTAVTTKAEKKAGAEPKVQAVGPGSMRRMLEVQWFEWLLVLCAIGASIAVCFFFGKRSREAP